MMLGNLGVWQSIQPTGHLFYQATLVEPLQGDAWNSQFVKFGRAENRSDLEDLQNFLRTSLHTVSFSLDVISTSGELSPFSLS